MKNKQKSTVNLNGGFFTVSVYKNETVYYNQFTEIQVLALTVYYDSLDGPRVKKNKKNIFDYVKVLWYNSRVMFSE